MEDQNVIKTFFELYKKELKEMKHANLILAGKTGVGKSTLINAAFRENVTKVGIGTPVTNEGDVRWFEKDGYPLRLYDTIGLELDEERRNRSLEIIKDLCHKAKTGNDPDKYIHAMWYCVACDCDRLEQFEYDYINGVSEEVDVVLVITKSFRKKHAERLIKAIEKDYPGLMVRNKVAVLAQDEDPEDCEEGEIPRKAFGVDDLVEITAQIMPESAQKAWCNAQKASIEMKANQAHGIVIATATASFGEGYIPLPFSDAVALIPTQIGMLAGITALFGISISENMLKSIVTSIAGVAGTTFAGRTIAANLLKLLPGAGTALGGTISGATAAMLTTALGEAYIIIMKMIATGEINEKDLETKAVQDRILEIFKRKLDGRK